MFTRSDSATFSNKWYPLCIRVAAMNSLFSLLLIFLIFEPNFAATTDKQKERKNPRLISLFPQGSHQGSFFDTTVRGEGLEGVHSVWFDCNHITGQVQKVIQFFKSATPTKIYMIIFDYVSLKTLTKKSR